MQLAKKEKSPMPGYQYMNCPEMVRTDDIVAHGLL
jgi:hypothetical protein